MTTRQLPQGSPRPEQLVLIDHPEVPLQFRLDERTRRRGLEHIAAIRRQLAVMAAQRNGSQRHPHAA